MTDRERWTIYPLLALSLGMQVRDKVFPVTTLRAQSIHCRSLVVDAANGKPRITASSDGILRVLGDDDKPKILLGSDQNKAGIVQVCGTSGQVRTALGVDEAQSVGTVSTFGSDGHPRVVIAAVDNSGMISTAGPGDRRLVELGIGKPWAGLTTPQAANQANDDQPPAAETVAQPLGGQLVLLAPDGKPQWLLTHDERGSGRALAFDSEGRLHLVLTATLNVIHGPPGRTQTPSPPADQTPPPFPTDPGPATSPAPDGAPSPADAPRSDAGSTVDATEHETAGPGTAEPAPLQPRPESPTPTPPEGP
ncbi:MAG: hypothetical protein K2Y37_10430 [Pirellulales bacterium]|nr:hypothetical protein [Pirellulales bacterium]